MTLRLSNMHFWVEKWTVHGLSWPQMVKIKRMNYQPAISHISLNASLSQFNKFIYIHIILQERSKGWVNMAGKSPNQIP